MARADLLLDLVRAGSKGDQPFFRKVVEALISEERAKQHHILADRMAAHLQANGGPNNTPAALPLRRNGTHAEFYYETHPERRLEDLLLPEAVRTGILEIIEEHRRADLLRAYGLEPRHRILLAGPPGNGKTSLAEALSAELALPLFVVRYEAVIASYLGETAVRLSRLFEQIRSRRCVLFFDEFDVVGKERGDVHETGEIKRVVSSLLLQIDSLPSHVVVVTATNHPELLDRAVWRRFQLRLDIPIPSSSLVQKWFSRFEERSGLRLGYAPAALAKHMQGLSFSELEQFSLDIQRRYVLGLPNADPHRIVQERLEQWKHRFGAKDLTTERTDA
jgi:predicted AAA+ superfamily ATPase